MSGLLLTQQYLKSYTQQVTIIYVTLFDIESCSVCSTLYNQHITSGMGVKSFKVKSFFNGEKNTLL